MDFLQILYVGLRVCFGLALLCLLLHYFHLLDARSRLRNSPSLFDRAFFAHQRGYYFVGDHTLVLGTKTSGRATARAVRLDEKYNSSALNDALLELFASNRYFPGNIILRSSIPFDLHFNSFSKYEVLRIDASAVVPGDVYLVLDGNETIMKITLPPVREISVIDIQNCEDLETIVFTGPPPAYTNSDPNRPVLANVSRDFCFTVPYKYLDAYKKSSLSTLYFTDDLYGKRPVSFRCDDIPAEEEEQSIPDGHYWRI